MGACATKVSGASSRRSNNTASKTKPNGGDLEEKKTEGTSGEKVEVPPTQQKKQKGRAVTVPCGKQTNFGYDRDFTRRYSIGKLLGHGQFGYTFVATDKENDDRVAVKRISKNKV